MKVNRPDEEVQAAMDEAALREMPKIDHRTAYLALLSNLERSRFGRMLAGDLEPFARLRFRYTAPGYVDAYEAFFRIPVTTQLGDPTVPLGAGGTLTRKLGRLDLRHRFGNGWTLRQAVFLHNVRSDDTTSRRVAAAGATPAQSALPSTRPLPTVIRSRPGWRFD